MTSSYTSTALSIPNLLTYLRVLMIPWVLYFLNRGTKIDHVYAAFIFMVAGITDLLDGYLARRFNLVSVLGKFLDPLADKLMVMACLIWLITLARIQAWIVILLIAREISMTGLRAIAASEGLVIAANESGKQKTAFQMIGLFFLILGYPYEFRVFSIDLGIVDTIRVGQALIALSLVMSLISAFQYCVYFGRSMSAQGKE